VIKIWQILKNAPLKGKIFTIWKLIMWCPVVISIVIVSVMVALFNLDIESGVDAFKEITQ